MKAAMYAIIKKDFRIVAPAHPSFPTGPRCSTRAADRACGISGRTFSTRLWHVFDPGAV